MLHSHMANRTHVGCDIVDEKDVCLLLFLFFGPLPVHCFQRLEVSEESASEWLCFPVLR